MTQKEQLQLGKILCNKAEYLSVAMTPDAFRDYLLSFFSLGIVLHLERSHKKGVEKGLSSTD